MEVAHLSATEPLVLAPTSARPTGPRMPRTIAIQPGRPLFGKESARRRDSEMRFGNHPGALEVIS